MRARRALGILLVGFGLSVRAVAEPNSPPAEAPTAAAPKPGVETLGPWKWTKLFCINGEMVMSSVLMSGLICRDFKAKQNYMVMEWGASYPRTMSQGQAVALWVHHRGDVSGAYGGGALGGSVGFGAQVGLYANVDGFRYGQLIFTGVNYRLVDEYMLLCTTPLTAKTSLILSAVTGKATVIHIMPTRHALPAEKSDAD